MADRNKMLLLSCLCALCRSPRVGYRKPVPHPMQPVPHGPKRNAHFGASFRCLRRLKLKKTIILNFSDDSALSVGYDSLSFNFESGGMHRVWLCEPVPSTSAVRLGAMGRPSPVPLKTWRPMMTRAALTQSSTVTLIHKSRSINNKLAIITMFNLAHSRAKSVTVWYPFFVSAAMITAFTGNMAEEFSMSSLCFFYYRFRHRYHFKSSGLAPVSEKTQTIPIPMQDWVSPAKSDSLCHNCTAAGVCVFTTTTDWYVFQCHIIKFQTYHIWSSS